MLDGWVLHRRAKGHADFLQYRRGRAFGGVHAVPDFHLKAFEALLVQRGHIGQRRQAVEGRYAKHLHTAVFDDRYGLRGLVAQQIHLPAQERIHGRTGA